MNKVTACKIVSVRLIFLVGIMIFSLDSPVFGQNSLDRKGVVVEGTVTDQYKKSVPNVVITDGYSCVSTNAKGEYSIILNESSKFVYYSTPSAYEITTESGASNYPSFYVNLDSVSLSRKKPTINFVLKKQKKVEKEFNIIGIADPQVRTEQNIEYFKNETVKDISETLSSYSVNSYGLVFGDVLYDMPEITESMKETLSSAPMPMFVAIGNHDEFPDQKTGHKTGEFFSDHFGPLNYSFNRGDVHFVGLDDILFTEDGKYKISFSDEQIEWLRQDLSYVPKNKMVVVYFHFPLMPLRKEKTYNKDKILDLLKDYAEVHLMSGHTHYNHNYIYEAPYDNIYEHVQAAACGAFWKSTINADGTPNGYAVYEVKGNRISNLYYKSVGYSKDFQIRLYKGDTVFGGDYGSFSFEQPSDCLVANVWNVDPDWTIEVYENNKKMGSMKPADFKKEAWAMGYHIGVLNRDPRHHSPNTTHLYTYKIKDINAKIRVVAKDKFGNVYSQDTITEDFSQAIR